MSDDLAFDEWLEESKATWLNAKEESLEPNDKITSVLQKEYTLYRCRLLLNESKVRDEIGSVEESDIHQWILQHRNGVMLIGISSTHPVFAAAAAYNSQPNSNERRISVTFPAAISSKGSLGKRKKGASQLNPKQTICTVEIPKSASDEGMDVFFLYGAAWGNIIESNDMLEEAFNRVVKIPSGKGTWNWWIVMVSAHSHTQRQKSLGLHEKVEVDCSTPL